MQEKDERDDKIKWYNEGDVVTIRSDLKEGGEHIYGVNDLMVKKRGEKIKIRKITKAGRTYKYFLEGSVWSWSVSMFENREVNEL